MGKLVYGVGINDADYSLYKIEFINGKQVNTWSCPFYQKWVSMLSRCYNEKLHNKHPSYIGCHSIPEWHYFMTFRAWMIGQDWEGKQLDKDILFPGNKLYGPDTCVFVDQKVNKFITERQNHRGEWPIGVHFYKRYNKFNADCCDVVTGKRKNLGYFNTPEEAHKAWLDFKLQQAYILASEQSDIRVAEALINRYKYYGQ